MSNSDPGIDPRPDTEAGDSNRRALVRSGSILSIITLASRVLGLIREIVKGAFLGTSALSDAFSAAFVIPNLLRRLFAEGSIAVAFIPTFKGYLIDGDREKTKEFLSAMFTVLAFFVTVTVLIGIALTPLIVRIFGTDPSETALLTRIMFPYLAVISLAALFQGILNSENIFTPSGLTPILFNISVILLTIFLSPHTANPARAMAIGVLTGGTLQALFQLPFVLKRGVRFPLMGLRRALRNPGVRTVFRLIAPTVIGMAAYQFNDIVSTALAGNAGEGILASLQYSLRLQELVLGVFAVSIGTVMLPELSAAAKHENWDDFTRQLSGAMRVIALITVPTAFFSVITSDHIITLLFKVNRFDERSVALTSYAFRYHMLGLFFIALNRIIAPAFYAQKNAKSPTIAGIASFAINILLAALLVGPMKGGGIALALSLSSAANTVLLLLMLRKNRHVDLSGIVRSTIGYTVKIAVFAVVAVTPVALVSKPLYGLFAGSGSRLISSGVPLLLQTIIFAGIGIACLAVSRDRQLGYIVSLVRRRSRR